MIKVIEKKIRGKVYIHLDIYAKGKRTTRSTGFILTGDPKLDKKMKQHANKLAAELSLKLADNNYNIDALRPGFCNFMEYYQNVINNFPHYKRRGDVYKYMLMYSGKFLEFSDINAGYWERFRNYLLNVRKFKPATVYTMYSILKSILNCAVRDKFIVENPLKGVIERKPKTERMFLSYNELADLKKHSCSNAEVKEAFLFSCFTGLRLGDILRIRWEDIRQDSIRIIQEKTRNFVSVPLTNPARELLNKRPVKEGLIFSLPAKSTISIIVKEWTGSAGLKNITFHSARHTFATLALTFGASIESISDMLGHADIRTTKIYARILDQKKREDADKFPDF